MKKILIFILCIFTLAFPSQNSAEIIINDSVVETSLTKDEVIKIFLFYRKFWEKSGARIVVVLPPPNSILFRKLALDELNTNSNDYYESIKSKMYAGAAQPVFTESEQEVLIKISNIFNHSFLLQGRLW